ncbi:cytochrome-c peroxidase [Plastorhodobacter daqingensis]|uniref:Cytochrome-c peroxidase n=1 Tax=Plastorhodobacter daqingensis TaxID=1387281 RepID=A0ABW2UQH9_9RHOB
MPVKPPRPQLARIAAVMAWAVLAALSVLARPGSGADAVVPGTVEALGERLFFDVNLSWNRTTACASCHDPARAFSDPRGAGSPGDDGVALGDRNAPTAMYAAMVPPLGRTPAGDWVGGLFHDGRAATLAEQAAGPPLNPAEMGMPDRAAVLERLREDSVYVAAFPALFGAGVLDDAAPAFDAMTAALEAFERTERFAPFTSRYDRWLRGEIALTPEEELGRTLFFSQQFTNCSRCHMGAGPTALNETFTDHRHHNIGTPENLALRAVNGVAPGTIDPGLGGVVGDPAALGRIRTPTLRNVAVTGPYMHNGVFADLRTVILYYNSYNTRSEARRINPETGTLFAAPQVPETLALDDLTHGPALDDRRIDALVAFLNALTDAEFEGAHDR